MDHSYTPSQNTHAHARARTHTHVTRMLLCAMLWQGRGAGETFYRFAVGGQRSRALEGDLWGSVIHFCPAQGKHDVVRDVLAHLAETCSCLCAGIALRLPCLFGGLHPSVTPPSPLSNPLGAASPKSSTRGACRQHETERPPLWWRRRRVLCYQPSFPKPAA